MMAGLLRLQTEGWPNPPRDAERNDELSDTVVGRSVLYSHSFRDTTTATNGNDAVRSNLVEYRSREPYLKKQSESRIFSDNVLTRFQGFGERRHNRVLM